MMPKARWQQIQSLFDELVDSGTGDREARLARACGNDAELRKSVESLLDSDRGSGDPLQHVIGRAAEALLEDHSDRLIGTRVGAYRITAILGHGGMSTVYRGERDQAQYRQTVAIKVLKHAALHPRMHSRLHSEKHILAGLDHPSIARLIDSGDLADDTPYLVMEYVDGETIDKYCDRRLLSVEQRLALFAQVCAAVHYAHRNLVVHRDIKPSNILVTESGMPKLLDFGIAKLLAPESAMHTLPVTLLQDRMLTPENAAPEQVLGRPITTATDIYALGVLLYQLLSGRSPYRLIGHSQLQLERAICMDEPARPSQAVMRPRSEDEPDRAGIATLRGLAPAKLRARLSGDVDAIVAVAMRKEPDRRYASAAALADDVNRHLAGEPVRARQGDWRYKGVKFLRRNCWAVAIVAVVVVGLAALASLLFWQNKRIAAASLEAQEQRDRAQQVSTFLANVFSKADPYVGQGKKETVEEVLARGAAQISTDTTLDVAVRADLLEVIAVAYRRQDELDQATALFEKVVDMRRHARPPNNLQIAVALANLARSLSDTGKNVTAEVNLRDAVALLRADGDTPSRQAGDILLEYGNFMISARGQPDAAAQMFAEARDTYRAALGPDSAEEAQALASLGSAAEWGGEFAKAEDYVRQALAIYQRTLPRLHPENAGALQSLGNILVERDKLTEAEQALDESLDIERNVFGATNYRVGVTYGSLGRLYERQGNIPKAIDATQAALRIARESPQKNTAVVGYYLDALGGLYLKAGDLATAEQYARDALSDFGRTLATPRHLYVASTRQVLGEIYLQRGDYAAAAREFRAAYELNGELAKPGHWIIARSEAALGWALIELGDAAEGEPLLTAGRARLVSALGADHPVTRQATERLERYLHERHRDTDAVRVLPAPDNR